MFVEAVSTGHCGSKETSSTGSGMSSEGRRLVETRRGNPEGVERDPHEGANLNADVAGSDGASGRVSIGTSGDERRSRRRQERTRRGERAFEFTFEVARPDERKTPRSSLKKVNDEGERGEGQRATTFVRPQERFGREAMPGGRVPQSSWKVTVAVPQVVTSAGTSHEASG